MKYPFEGENILKISNKDSDNSEYQTFKKKIASSVDPESST